MYLSFSISSARNLASLSAAIRAAARSLSNIVCSVATSLGSGESAVDVMQQRNSQSALFVIPSSRNESQSVLRQTPINAFQLITELRRCHRHNCIGTAAGNAKWPDEAAALQPLGKQAHALAIMPQYFH